MAKERGDLLSCLLKTKGHVAPPILKIMILMEDFNTDSVRYRFGLVEENMANAIAQLKKVIVAAEKANCKEVLDALNEKIEIDHSRPKKTAD